MLTESNGEELAGARSLREHQEREIALRHALAAAEHALAQEAFVLGRMLQAEGVAFDPLTFVVLRICEGSEDQHVDPITCLRVLIGLGFLERSVARAIDLLDDAA
jgi:hypothetical protein